LRMSAFSYACVEPLFLINCSYLRKWNLLCVRMSGISPRFPLFHVSRKINVNEERKGGQSVIYWTGKMIGLFYQI